MANQILSIKEGFSEVHFEYFDSDKELEIWIENTRLDSTLHVYLTPNNVNDLISHLVKQLQKVGEPVEILQK